MFYCSLHGQDALTELGRGSSSMRIDMGAREGMIDSLFVGQFLGRKSDIASGELRTEELRTLNNIVGDYYVPPAFMDAVALHMVKNILADEGQLAWKVPLILGIWGEKGCGKSFNVELACKKMAVQPIVMSAGELEDEWAGAPGKRIRERYRKASQVIRNSGVFSCLVINDLDAGVGRFRDTQVTVDSRGCPKLITPPSHITFPPCLHPGDSQQPECCRHADEPLRCPPTSQPGRVLA